MAAALALAAIGASAQEDDTMYLVKGDRVVGKYNVDAVDYITFRLPDDVRDEAMWLTVDNVGKNTVTYTVNAATPTTTYAHNLLSYYDVNYFAMDTFGDMLDNLGEEEQVMCLKQVLASNAFLGTGTQSVTQTDFEQWDQAEYARFSVMPGTKYYLCAWEVDPETQEPLETFIYQTLQTLPSDEVDLGLDIQFKANNAEGMAFTFTGSDKILYVRTCWGMADMMEAYEQAYGRDFLMGTFGQNWTLAFLAGYGDLQPDIENATWPAYDPGEYVMYCDAYDAQGNVQHFKQTYTYETGEVSEGPTITIYSKDKGIKDGKGFVKVNFEISPSNVEEAYVRMAEEDWVDDRVNMGYTLADVACGGDATDITNAINTTGEYTFESDEVGDAWMSILIYAKDKEGGKTVQRLNFNTLEGSEWAVPYPVHAPKAIAPVKKIKSKRNPSIARAGR